METIIKLEAGGQWNCQLWDGERLVYFKSPFPTYNIAKADARARLSEVARGAATGGSEVTDA